MPGQDKRDRLYNELLCDWLSSTRREALLIGGGALAYFLDVFHRAYADAEFQIQVSPQEGTKSDTATVGASQNDNASTPARAQEKTERPAEEEADIGMQLGIAYRAPMLQDLTTAQFRATNTPERMPNYLSVAPNTFFSDSPNRMFLSNGESALATAFRSTATSKANLQGTKPAADRFTDLVHLRASQITGSNIARFFASVEWPELAKSTGELTFDKALDFVKEKAVKHIYIKIGMEAFLPWYDAISIVHDVLTPTELNGGRPDELTYMDRLSPAERREFIESVMRYSPIPKEMPPAGPTLNRAD